MYSLDLVGIYYSCIILQGCHEPSNHPPWLIVYPTPLKTHYRVCFPRADFSKMAFSHTALPTAAWNSTCHRQCIFITMDNSPYSRRRRGCRLQGRGRHPRSCLISILLLYHVKRRPAKSFSSTVLYFKFLIQHFYDFRTHSWRPYRIQYLFLSSNPFFLDTTAAA